MWFEILPAGIIIQIFLTTPMLLIPQWHKIVFKNKYRRDLHWGFDQGMYLRDRRLDETRPLFGLKMLGHNPYRQRMSLDYISDTPPDSENDPCKKKKK